MQELLSHISMQSKNMQILIDIILDTYIPHQH